MTRFRDMPREPLPPAKPCETIGKGSNERPLVYGGGYARSIRRRNGQTNHFRQRMPGAGIPHEHQSWHRDDAHKETA